MLCIPITGPTLSEASRQISESLHLGGLLEFRLDLFQPYEIKNLKKLREEIKKPILFTLRKKEQGGSYEGSEEERLKEIWQVACLSPTYLDLEYDISPTFAKEIATAFPDLKLIISFHDFTGTSTDLETILKRMQSIPAHYYTHLNSRIGFLPAPVSSSLSPSASPISPPDMGCFAGLKSEAPGLAKLPILESRCVYKLACMATSTNDSLRMMGFARKHAPILGMCMGEKGEITRILGPIMGVPWTYSYVDQKTAPGQLSAGELQSIYAIHRLRGNSAIYGLIGGAVTKSLSHFTHNSVMRESLLDAVYVKMAIEKEELKAFFSLAKDLGIKGLSVTMPLKEKVMPFLDYIDRDAEKIGAVNTILFREGKLLGYNTDGKGALDAIEAKVRVEGKRVVVLGAGGAARAIIYEAVVRRADVCVLNRTKERAFYLAREFGVRGGGLDLVQEEEYDILINTTPHPLPISKAAIRPYTFVMDIKSSPKMSLLLEEARHKKCTLIFGYEMFTNQAVEQYHIWFSSQLNKERVHQIIQEEALKHL